MLTNPNINLAYFGKSYQVTIFIYSIDTLFSWLKKVARYQSIERRVNILWHIPFECMRVAFTPQLLIYRTEKDSTSFSSLGYQFNSDGQNQQCNAFSSLWVNLLWQATLAKELEGKHSALSLTPDEWMARIVGNGYDEARRAAVEAAQWEIAARVLKLGVNVILDWCFCPRKEAEIATNYSYLWTMMPNS